MNEPLQALTLTLSLRASGLGLHHLHRCLHQVTASAPLLVARNRKATRPLILAASLQGSVVESRLRHAGSPPPDRHLPVTRSGSVPPWPVGPPGSTHCCPQLPTDSPVDAWLSTVFRAESRPPSPPSHRPSTCPATVDVSKDTRTAPSLAMIWQMSRSEGTVGSGSGTTRSSRPGPCHPGYRGTLFHNNITMDLSGRRVPEELRTVARTQILKRRDSPPLGDDAVSRVIDAAEQLADGTEGPMAELIRTDMFPLERPGIAEGGKCPWNSAALPHDTERQHGVSTPRPDFYFGYPTNQSSLWSGAQHNVITHAVACPYTQPARGNTFPFLMVEMKSEAAGGTLYVAENQAAGGGSESVNALRLLFKNTSSGPA